jgi:DNA-binding GntR family transcriptional regulator
MASAKIKTAHDEQKTGTTLATSVYDRLRADVLAGRLAPGEKLRTDFLRERYQAGISPIREALSQLSSDGLVVREDQKGFRVAAVSKSDLLDLVKTRCWLEEVAIRESIAGGGMKWEEELVLAFHRLSRFPRPAYDSNPEETAIWEGLHRAFHMALIAGCGSRWLTANCGELFDKTERYRRLAAGGVPKRDELAEHRAILEAVLESDLAKVTRLLHEHYGRTVDVILSSDFKLMD